MVVDVKRSKQVDEQEVKRRAAECGTYRQGMPRLRPTMSSATFGVLRLAFISPAVLYQKDIDYSTIRPPENPPKSYSLHTQDIMKFLLVTLTLAVLAVTASAVATQKAVIVSYPQDAPDSIMSEAMDAIREAVSNEFHSASTVC